MFAGAARIDITPRGSVWMDGMLRDQPSAGIHDLLLARALVLRDGRDVREAFVLVSVDVCVLDEETVRAVRLGVEARTGIAAWRVVVAATHTHSGPATVGIFNPREDAYVQSLIGMLIALVEKAFRNLQPAAAAVAAGREETISHYRRLKADDGRVVMNWEPFPPERIVEPLGVADPEVGVVKVVAAGEREAHPGTGRVLALLFNHAGHPNVLSGDNHLLSADYPGLAARRLQAEFGGEALFFNGALGSVDIDGLRDRDWEGLARAGRALAQSAAETARALKPSGTIRVRGACTRYALPGRRITDAEWAWAQEILAVTGGRVHGMADGVGDDYKATLYRQLREAGPRNLPVEQTCVALGDNALLTFPGELFTEIGLIIKEQSPFGRTFILGLANGYVGYVPTRKAIAEGGYAEDTRRVDEAAEQVVIEQSLALLRSVHALQAPAEGTG